MKFTLIRTKTLESLKLVQGFKIKFYPLSFWFWTLNKIVGFEMFYNFYFDHFLI
jgi:hypothetical protein